MNKVTVTKAQMEAIKDQRDYCKRNLNSVIKASVDENIRFLKRSEPLNNMSLEKIVLAWHGHAEVEPEFINFFEAMKAVSLGKNVDYHYAIDLVVDGRILDKTLKINLVMKPTFLNSDTEWRDLVNGKFTIEGDNK